jgi:hypothetical protein
MARAFSLVCKCINSVRAGHVEPSAVDDSAAAGGGGGAEVPSGRHEHVAQEPAAIGWVWICSVPPTASRKNWATATGGFR